MDYALNTTFGTRNFSNIGKKNPTKITLLSETFRSAVLAFANAVYVKQIIYFTQNACQQK